MNISDGKGRSIESLHTFQQARAILEKMPNKNTFAQDLLRATKPSIAQTYWIHKLACDANIPVAIGVAVPEMSKILALFNDAKKHLKKPRITFILSNDEVVLSMAGDESRNPGHLYLKVNEVYRGKITPAGKFIPFECDSSITEYLRKFAENPVLIAANYGKETQVCCFCATELTDDRSRAMGYGPICARRWNLPVPY